MAAGIEDAAPVSLGAGLERARLQARERRLTSVLRALQERHRIYAAAGTPRVPLQAAIRDFGIELDQVRRRLAQ